MKKSIRSYEVGDIIETDKCGDYITTSEVTEIKETDAYYAVLYKKLTINKKTAETWGSELCIKRAKYLAVNGPKEGQLLMEMEAPKGYIVYNCSYKRQLKDPRPSAVLVYFK